MSTMTASATHTTSAQQSTPGQPPLRRLLGAAVVAGLGVMAFSVAIGSHVAATRTGFGVVTGGDGGRNVPLLVLVGVVHLIVAIALVRERDVTRVAGVVVTGLTAIAAGAA